MQHAIRAGRAGRIANVLARAGELVEAEAVLFDIDPGLKLSCGARIAKVPDS